LRNVWKKHALQQDHACKKNHVTNKSNAGCRVYNTFMKLA